MKKWLNIKPKLNDFSEDEFDTDGGDEVTAQRMLATTSLRYMKTTTPLTDHQGIK